MKNETPELIALLVRATAYIQEVGRFGPRGGPEFIPNMADAETKLAIEIRQAIQRATA